MSQTDEVRGQVHRYAAAALAVTAGSQAACSAFWSSWASQCWPGS